MQVNRLKGRHKTTLFHTRQRYYLGFERRIEPHLLVRLNGWMHGNFLHLGRPTNSALRLLSRSVRQLVVPSPAVRMPVRRLLTQSGGVWRSTSCQHALQSSIFRGLLDPVWDRVRLHTTYHFAAIKRCLAGPDPRRVARTPMVRALVVSLWRRPRRSVRRHQDYPTPGGIGVHQMIWLKTMYRVRILGGLRFTLTPVRRAAVASRFIQHTLDQLKGLQDEASTLLDGPPVRSGSREPADHPC